MKFNFFSKNKKDEPTCDCKCGCSEEARDSVRLTDAEIAQDIISELDALSKEYKSLLSDGCDCAEKLRSCEACKNRICDYLKEAE